MIAIKGNINKYNQKPVDKIEKIVGATLPKEYIQFLRKHNGGFPEANIVISETAPECIITSFYGTDVEPVHDLYSRFKTFEGRVPNRCIPIASDAGGNLVVLNVRNPNYGYVFFWDHEEDSGDKEMNLNDLCLIAPSFNEFLTLIKPAHIEEDLRGYEVKEVWVDTDFLKDLKSII
ncbi:SMI1/KNR4 family protein [Rossellomorea vietnamensis]|uniref:SMI1/KNR4 family protein n=1 Tax=Rossellomorea vietnamensis TaxID=218284 RepID=UPI001E4FD23A|nr:SMI1/KNR4 family protein [Rossellomorea vietnamensis]MCC5801853.1 SMI1/KNR4 family protein [Rossellomorea vietnamensis]